MQDTISKAKGSLAVGVGNSFFFDLVIVLALQKRITDQAECRVVKYILIFSYNLSASKYKVSQSALSAEKAKRHSGGQKYGNCNQGELHLL